MFTLSMKGIYGLVALYELALHYGKNHIQIKQIATAHRIPQHYLEQLLLNLKKAGLVKSFRGNQGGYSLAHHPSKIRVFEILKCLEGDLKLRELSRQSDALAFFWEELETMLKTATTITLDELVVKKRSFENQLNYNI